MPMLEQSDLYLQHTGEHHTYRIPALVVTGRGTVLAFAEGRRDSASDASARDLVLRRSLDTGKTWAAQQIVIDGAGAVCGNPAPVVDASDGRVWLLFCLNPVVGEERHRAGQYVRTVWITHSDDDGVSWADPREISDQARDPEWTTHATGPCHGVQLASGRLLIPSNHRDRVYNDRRRDPKYSHVIYSDDHGSTWHIGASAQEDTNESVAVQLADGTVYLNCRNYRGAKRRAVARSQDEGETFTDVGYAETLIEPICQASAIRYTTAEAHGRNRVLFSNPASTVRERMTVRISYDECQSWSEGRVLHPGPAAYSDLCVLPDMTVGCLYECGETTAYERLRWARFDLEWLTDRKDSLG
jgi:sialidase-1